MAESSSGQNVKISIKYLETTELYTFSLYGVGGIMVSIAAFQAVDPGSIPGRRNF